MASWCQHNAQLHHELQPRWLHHWNNHRHHHKPHCHRESGSVIFATQTSTGFGKQVGDDPRNEDKTSPLLVGAQMPPGMPSKVNPLNDDALKAIDLAEEGTVEVDDGVILWFRTWGNKLQGTPVLFVHGGPGNCVADYEDINAEFFPADQYFVVEVDQRGTGASQPSVRDNYVHMQVYRDISIAQMSRDFEKVREKLGIQQWLVFGGSWGSTLGLDYTERYPEKCLGLIVRGIYLNTVPEFLAIYSRDPFLNHPRRLAEFDTFFKIAADEATRRGETSLDPNDAQRFIQVFENNLMEEDPEELLDPLIIQEELFPEAQSVAFFESRLFLRGTYEEPIDLMGNLSKLLQGPKSKPVPTWVVQGIGDEVCPAKFAEDLVQELKAVGVPTTSYFVDAGHKASSDGVSVSLKKAIIQFGEQN